MPSGNDSFPWLDLGVAAVYLLVSVLLGAAFSGKQRDLRTFLLAGGQMNSILVATSIVAALFSGISFLAAPSESFHHNLVILWATVAYFISTPITVRVFIPLFFRIRLYTAYQYLENRFDRRMRRIASASFMIR